ncbi:MAG: cytochrome c family protein [Bacteroidota bacterium]
MLLKRTLFFALLALFASGTMLAQNFKYIGAPKCKMCHNKPAKGEQYNVWSKGPHAGAMKSLSSEQAMEIAKEKGIADPTTDAGCIKCHSTVGHIDTKLAASIKIVEGVSCESCHGPGSMYKGASIMKNQELAMQKGLILPTEEVCKTCHNEESPTYKPFVFAEKVAEIAHPNPSK